MNQAEQRELNRLKDLAALVSENFNDYVLIVRVPNGLNWKFSDNTFALGACERLRNTINDKDNPSISFNINHP